MRYVTGMFALNLPCSLDTSGDWHTSGMDWEHVQVWESSGSVLGDWGIEQLQKTQIRQIQDISYVADTLRALVDLLIEGRYSCVQGARDDYITNPKYFQEFFEHVYMLRDLSNWDGINEFMNKEFRRSWWEWRIGK